MVLRQARKGEEHTAYQCIEDAMVYHKSLGFVQWHPNYPTLSTIAGDMENGNGFVFAEGDVISGCAIESLLWHYFHKSKIDVCSYSSTVCCFFGIIPSQSIGIGTAPFSINALFPG